jgi:hypothetical protein
MSKRIVAAPYGRCAKAGTMGQRMPLDTTRELSAIPKSKGFTPDHQAHL